MIVILTVAEVAEICGVSVQMIHKRIKAFTPDELNLYLNQVETRFKQITPEGLLYFKSVYGISTEPKTENKKNSADSDIVALLTEQLRIKDEQISTLMEQNRNFQILLKAEQDKQLPPPKIPLLKRLFGKADN